MRAEKTNIPLTLGLISVPVNVYTSVETERKDVTFNTVCAGNGTPHSPAKVNQQYHCPTCETVGKLGEFVKGRANSDGGYVIVDKAEIDAVTAAAVPADVRDSITLTAHSAEQVEASTMPNGKVYYVGPGKGAGEAYNVLVALVSSRPSVAFNTVFAIRTSPAMYRLGVHNGVLTLSQLAWPEQVKQAPATVAGTVSAELLELAMTFADKVMTEFDPTTFVDTRRQVLAAFLDGQDVTAPAPEVAPTAPAESPLLAALKAAVAPPKPKRVRKRAAKPTPITTAPSRRKKKVPA